jgi:hypothetical protein
MRIKLITDDPRLQNWVATLISANVTLEVLTFAEWVAAVPDVDALPAMVDEALLTPVHRMLLRQRREQGGLQGAVLVRPRHLASSQHPVGIEVGANDSPAAPPMRICASELGRFAGDCVRAIVAHAVLESSLIKASRVRQLAPAVTQSARASQFRAAVVNELLCAKNIYLSAAAVISSLDVSRSRAYALWEAPDHGRQICSIADAVDIVLVLRVVAAKRGPVGWYQTVRATARCRHSRVVGIVSRLLGLDWRTFEAGGAELHLTTLGDRLAPALLLSLDDSRKSIRHNEC